MIILFSLKSFILGYIAGMVMVLLILYWMDDGEDNKNYT